MSDKGPQYTSYKFKNFHRSNIIKQTLVRPKSKIIKNKSEIAMKVSGWAQVSHEKNWRIITKYSYTSTDILGQYYTSITSVFCLYICY